MGRSRKVEADAWLISLLGSVAVIRNVQQLLRFLRNKASHVGLKMRAASRVKSCRLGRLEALG
jgi:hypothetical protein